MTQSQRDYINEVKVRVRDLDFSGSAYPMSDDPTGEVLIELLCIARDYRLEIVRKDGMIILMGHNRMRPSHN